jgi:hypothetical protein
VGQHVITVPDKLLEAVMIARIRLKQGGPVRRKRGKNRHLALAFGALLIPASLMAYVLGFWRLASDMGLAGEFGITGSFSHWQIWIACGLLTHVVASALTRYGRGGDFEVPKLLSFRLFPAVRPAAESTSAADRKVGT